MYAGKFVGSSHQPHEMTPINAIDRYDLDHLYHAPITDGGLNYGAMPNRIARIWTTAIRSLGAANNLSMSSSLQEVILPHRPVVYPAGRGTQGVSNLASGARAGDSQMYVPGIFIQAAPISR